MWCLPNSSSVASNADEVLVETSRHLPQEQLRQTLEQCLPALLQAELLPLHTAIMAELQQLRELLPTRASTIPEERKDSLSSTELPAKELRVVSSFSSAPTLLENLASAEKEARPSPPHVKGARENHRAEAPAVLREDDAKNETHSCGSTYVGSKRFCCQALHPDGALRTLWDAVVLLTFVSDLLYASFELSFLQGEKDESVLGIFEAYVKCSYSIWLVDILINLHTGYLSNHTCLVVISQPSSAIYYLRTWCFLDVIATLPSLLAYALISSSTAHRLILMKLLKLTRLVRLAKISVLRRRLSMLESRTDSKSIVCLLCMLQLLGILFMASHLAACALWHVGRQTLSSDGGEADSSWIRSRSNLEMESLAQQYVTAMHFSVGIMTGMGLNSFSTSAMQEELLLSLYYLLALALMGVIVNEVAAVYTKMNESSSSANMALVDAMNFMRWHSVPQALQARVERYLRSVFSHKDNIDTLNQLSMLLRVGSPGDGEPAVSFRTESMVDAAPATAEGGQASLACRDSRRTSTRNILQGFDACNAGDLGIMAELELAVFGRFLLLHPQLKMLPPTGKALALVASLCELVFLPPGEAMAQPGWQPHHLLCMRKGAARLKALASCAENTDSSTKLHYRSEIVRQAPSSSPMESTGQSSAGRRGPQRGWLPWAAWSGRCFNEDQKSLPEAEFSSDVSLSERQPLPVLSWEELAPFQEGDMLFSARLLLPCSNACELSCVCASFCEVVALKIDTFGSVFGQHFPLLLQELQLSAAVHMDSPEWLEWALHGQAKGKSSYMQSQRVQALLHECARGGAARCIHWLVRVKGFRTDIRDSTGRLPLEVAKTARQKAALDALVLEGALAEPDQPVASEELQELGGAKIIDTPSAAGLASDWSRLCSRAASRRRPRCIEALQEGGVYDSCEALQAFLEASGVDLSAWVSHGRSSGGAKGVDELFREMQGGYGRCVTSALDGSVVRTLCVARVRIHAVCSGGQEKVLSETEHQCWLDSTGRALRLPMRKMCPGSEGLEAALKELWQKVLGVDEQLVDVMFERGAERVYEEVKESASYPGLPCVYVVHEVPYWARLGEGRTGSAADQAAVESCFEAVGLPDGGSFERTEDRRRIFAWVDIAHQRFSPAPSDIGGDAERQLMDDLNAGACDLLHDADYQCLVRVTSLVCLRIFATASDASKRVLTRLVLKHDEAPLRKRLPAKVMVHQRIEAALEELWNEILGPGSYPTLVQQHFGRHGKVVYEYPGELVPEDTKTNMRTAHIVHEVSYTAMQPLQELCRDLPLPPEAAEEAILQAAQGCCMAWLPQDTKLEAVVPLSGEGMQ
eukprot:TRINITY_DN81855_c0_g1_i1.p1 TRINITY_DN81855_c0_g1~~TRINITY_DN81855_c0_g1_i1.p1  ORF type:complete len:1324 (+),score=259.04 TRINITY_DN81855_c0_g1_i1:58-4029(+)